jgi:hypothetical protein
MNLLPTTGIILAVTVFARVTMLFMEWRTHLRRRLLHRSDASEPWFV